MNTIKAKDKNGNEVRVKAKGPGQPKQAKRALLRGGYVLTGLRQKKLNRRPAA